MRRRAFPGYGPEVEAKYQRAAKWLLATIYRSEPADAWCKKNGVLIKAASEGVGSSGAFLVPAELSRAILDLREVYGAFRRRARIVPMMSDHEDVPRRPGGQGAFFTAENAAVTESSSTSGLVDTLGLTAKKIGSLIRLSNELDEDAIVEAVDFIANEIAWAFAAKEDDCGFNGDGTSTYGKMTGICKLVLDGTHSKAKVVAAHNTFITLDATDLGNLIAGVQAGALPNAAWYCSQVGFALTFCRLASTGGGFMDTRDVDGIPTPFYLGFPVIVSAKMPQTTSAQSGAVMMAFGDLYKAAALGERRGVTMARSDERYMDQDQIAVLGTERFHTVIHDIGDNTNVGALAALVGS